MATHVHGRLSTEPSNIADLMADIGKGEIKVPKFQRPFVWQAKQALALLDSLASGYPIGSLLLWKTADRLKAERKIGDFALPDTDEMSPTRYVLDGQQRLTVMYSAFGAKPGGGGFEAYYDLRNEKFIHSPDPVEVHYYPLRLTYRTTEFLDFRTALQTLHDAREIQDRLDALIKALTGYRLPVVELRELSVEEVCPIFERINSSGTKLSTFDLIAAATWTQDFDLTDQAELIAESIEPKGFDGISKETTLKCITAVLLGSIKREDVLTLRSKPKEEIFRATNDTQASLLATIDLLGTEFGVLAMPFLPYEAQMVSLVRLIHMQRTFETEQLRRLRQWFWRTSFSQHYRGASEAFVSKSLGDLESWVRDGKGNASDWGGIPGPSQIAGTNFHFRGATSKALVLAMAQRKPRNVTNGSAIDVGEALSVYNKRQFHHIYPQAHLKHLGGHPLTNSLANICMLAARENNAVSDSDPAEYLPMCFASLGEEAQAVFESLLIPLPDSFEYSSGEFEAFITTRSKLLQRHYSQMCEGNA